MKNLTNTHRRHLSCLGCCEAVLCASPILCSGWFLGIPSLLFEGLSCCGLIFFFSKKMLRVMVGELEIYFVASLVEHFENLKNLFGKV